jgi:hypothetical protein
MISSFAENPAKDIHISFELYRESDIQYLLCSDFHECQARSGARRRNGT